MLPDDELNQFRDNPGTLEEKRGTTTNGNSLQKMKRCRVGGFVILTKMTMPKK